MELEGSGASLAPLGAASSGRRPSHDDWSAPAWAGGGGVIGDDFALALGPLDEGGADELGSLAIGDLDFAIGIGGSPGPIGRWPSPEAAEAHTLVTGRGWQPVGAPSLDAAPTVRPVTPYGSAVAAAAARPARAGPPQGRAAATHVWAPGGVLAGHRILAASSPVLLGQSEATLAWGVNLGDGKGMIARAALAGEHFSPARLALEPTFQPVHGPVADLAKPPSLALLLAAVGNDVCAWQVGLDASLRSCTVLQRTGAPIREVDADNTRVASGGYSNCPLVSDIQTGAVVASWDVQSVVSSVKLHSVGSLADTVSFSTESGSFHLFDLRQPPSSRAGSYTAPRSRFYAHDVVEDHYVVLGTAGGTLLSFDIRIPGCARSQPGRQPQLTAMLRRRVGVTTSTLHGVEGVGSLAFSGIHRQWQAAGESGEQVSFGDGRAGHGGPGGEPLVVPPAMGSVAIHHPSAGLADDGREEPSGADEQAGPGLRNEFAVLLRSDGVVEVAEL